MIPEKTVQRWAARIEELRQRRGDLELPYPSGTALAIAGRYPYPELVSTLGALAHNAPDELPLDGGTVRSKVIEKMLAEGKELRGLRAMESVWLATDLALYIAAPNIDRIIRWGWSDTTVRPTKQGSKFSKATVHSGDATYEIRLSAKALTNLLVAQAWVKS